MPLAGSRAAKRPSSSAANSDSNRLLGRGDGNFLNDALDTVTYYLWYSNATRTYMRKNVADVAITIMVLLPMLSMRFEAVILLLII